MNVHLPLRVITYELYVYVLDSLHRQESASFRGLSGRKDETSKVLEYIWPEDHMIP